MAAAFVFPGQGSQAVGMGKALAEAFPQARAVFDEVDAALGEKLTATMWEGPADTLTLTENAQPALMAVSLAVMRVLEAEAGVDLKRDAQFVAGHSLGEYSALAAAGAFSISDTAKLLRIRGRAMQQAVPVGTGAMAALLGLELDAAAAAAAEAAQGEICDVANDNGGGQVVVSGNTSAVERAVEIAKAKGAKRAMMLKVSAPFHCALMKPAADAMAEALGRTNVKPPVVPVVANVLAKPISDPQDIVRRLVDQVTGTVRWRECVAFMAGAGVTTFYEIGSGKVLTGLLKRIADGATGTPIGTPDEVKSFKSQWQQSQPSEHPSVDAIPPQVSQGLTFGGDEQTPIRLVDVPVSSDTPDQRQTYSDIREKAEILRAECGKSNRFERIKRGALQLRAAMGQQFSDLQIRAFWAQMNSLRLRSEADVQSREEIDPESPPLPPELAGLLKDLVGTLNVFAAKEPRLVELDQLKVDPALRAESNLSAAQKIAEATIEAVVVVEREAAETIKQISDDSKGDSPAAQRGKERLIDSARNFVLEAMRRAYGGIRDGAYKAAGGAAVAAIGYGAAQLIKANEVAVRSLISTLGNADVLQKIIDIIVKAAGS
jgi:[acyl-carrier-protein] S-malonyltransferase